MAWWTSYSFYLIHSICKGEKPTCDFAENKPFNIGFRDLQTGCFQTWYDDRDLQALHSDISLDDFDLHSKSHLYEKSKTSVPIFMQIWIPIWMKFSALPQPVGLLKFLLKLFCIIFKGENSAAMILWTMQLALSCSGKLLNWFQTW